MASSVEVFRYDKNFVSNLSRICEVVDKGDSSLIRALLCYFSWEHQHSIFNEGILDPEKFARDYNFSVSRLHTRHEDPYQLQNLTEAQRLDLERGEREEALGGKAGYRVHRQWDSILENALYVLQNKPINIVATGGHYRYEDGGEPVKGSISIQVIRELQCFVRGRKVMYWYSLNPDFVRNLTGYFLNARRDSLLELRSKALDELYLNLVNLKANLLSSVPARYRTEAGYTPSFDTVCRWAHIPENKKDGTPYEAKARKRDLNNAFKCIRESTELDFEVEWCLTEPLGCLYTPCFIFSVHETKGYVIRSNKDNEFRIMFLEELKRHMGERYRQMKNVGRIDFLSEESFYAWLSSRSDREEKRNAFENAYYEVYKNIPDNIDGYFSKFLEQAGSGRRIEDMVF